MRFHLPAGTIVKYGTTTRALADLLERGVQPSPSSQPLLDAADPVRAAGAVYVGDLLAYASAYRQAAAHAAEVLLPEGGVRDPAKAAIPVVLRIELEEPCEAIAPEELLPAEAGAPDAAALDSHARSVWETFRYAGIVCPGGIPLAWVTALESPLFASANRPAYAPQTEAQLYADLWLILAGLLVRQHRIGNDELRAEFARQGRPIPLSFSDVVAAPSMPRWVRRLPPLAEQALILETYVLGVTQLGPQNGLKVDEAGAV